MIYDIRSNEIEDFCKSNKMFARVIDHEHDIQTYMNVIKSFPQQPISKDGNGKYKSIGLQYRDSNDQFYDSVESVWYMNDRHESIINTISVLEWKEWNTLGLMLGLEDYDLYRTRVLKAEAGCEGPMHIDYDWRYHIPLVTNKHCFIQYKKEKVHMPADGYAYINNAGFMHTFSNKGAKDRYHICGILNQPCEGDGQWKRCL